MCYKNIFNKGFLLPELMVGLFVAAIMYNTIAANYVTHAKVENARANAVQHKAFAQAYSTYITNNYGTIINAIESNNYVPYVIKYTTLVSSGYINSNINFNPVNWVPCAIVVLESQSSTLYPLVFDVTSNANNVSGTDSISGAGYLGYYAGSFRNNVITSYSGWSINTANSVYQFSTSLQSCDYATIAPNSIAINLIMAPFFMNVNRDVSLNRIADATNNSAANKNRLKTDIIMAENNAYHSIFFSRSTSYASGNYCTSGMNSLSPYKTMNANDMICPSNRLLADSIQSESVVTAGTACAEIGRIVVDAGNGTYNTSRANLVCSYNPVMCTLRNGNSARSSCYLPIQTNAVYIVNAANTTSFTCPADFPIAVNAKTNTALVPFTLCRNNSPSVCPAAGAKIMTTLVPYGNATILESVAVAGTVYRADVRALAMPAFNSANCTMVCGLFANSTITATTPNCICRAPNIDYIVVSGAVTGNSNLHHVVCSNKTVVQ